MNDKKPGVVLLLTCALVAALLSAPAPAQSFGDMLKNTVKRAAKGEVQRKADQETRKAARCAMGDAKCQREEARQTAASGESVPRSAADHPLVPRYAGSDILLYQSDDYTDYALRTGKAQSSGTRMLEGKITRITYRAPASRSPLEVFRNYENALREAGFQTVFACAKAACGDIKKDIESEKRYLLFWGDGEHRYMSSKLSRPQGDVYVTVYTTRNGSGGENRHRAITQVDVVEPRGMDDNVAMIDADALRRDLADGSATLYGIQFDSGTDRLQPEAEEQIVQIARLLEQEPRWRIQVIGHTDAQGSETSNIDLSERRARRVVDRLDALGTDRARLQARGLGESMPVAGNDSEEGRARNRRVEIRR